MKGKKIRFDIVTIFPNIFDSYLKESLFKRAQKTGIIDVHMVNLRDFAEGKRRISGDDLRRTVDDKPFGGGAGMVLKFEPIEAVVRALRKKSKGKTRVILFSTRGKKLDASVAKRLAKYDEIILLCGRYEGVDERVAEHIADEEISIGDYILSGGELPAIVLIEAVSRFIPGFLGKYESLEDVKGSYPVYTRPEVVKVGKKKIEVPSVLLSGNHKKIDEWRKSKR